MMELLDTGVEEFVGGVPVDEGSSAETQEKT
jgi:hypothetical protein